MLFLSHVGRDDLPRQQQASLALRGVDVLDMLESRRHVLVNVGKDTRRSEILRAPAKENVRGTLHGQKPACSSVMAEMADRKSTRLNSSHYCASRIPYSA